MAPGRGGRGALALALIGLAGCAGGEEKAPGDADGAAGAGEDGTGDGGDTASPPVEVGAFTITGQLVDPASGEPVAAPVCLRLDDPAGVPTGAGTETLWTGAAADDGTFSIPDVAPATTLGLLLVAEACSGDDWAPTAAYLPVEAWAGRGPGRPLSGVALPVFSREALGALDDELIENGSTVSLVDEGGIVGAIIDPEWGPVDGGWVRGPDPADDWYALWYDKGGGAWLSFDGSSSEGGARFAIPGAPWGAWLCRASATDFPVLLGGGVPGVVIVHDYTPW